MKTWFFLTLLIIIFRTNLEAQDVDSLIFQLDYKSERPFDFKHRVFLILKTDSTYNYIDYIGNPENSYKDYKNWKKEIYNGKWHSIKKNEIIINERHYRLKKKKLTAKKLVKIENKFGYIYKFPIFGKREKYKLIESETSDL